MPLSRSHWQWTEQRNSLILLTRSKWSMNWSRLWFTFHQNIHLYRSINHFNHLHLLIDLPILFNFLYLIFFKFSFSIFLNQIFSYFLIFFSLFFFFNYLCHDFIDVVDSENMPRLHLQKSVNRQPKFEIFYTLS